jgi:hypothetical protein
MELVVGGENDVKELADMVSNGGKENRKRYTLYCATSGSAHKETKTGRLYTELMQQEKVMLVGRAVDFGKLKAVV